MRLESQTKTSLGVHQRPDHSRGIKNSSNFISLLYPDSIKVALGIGQLRIWKLFFGSHSSKSLQWAWYPQM